MKHRDPLQIILGIVLVISVVMNLFLFSEWRNGRQIVDQAQFDTDSVAMQSTLDSLMQENAELRRLREEQEKNTEEEVKAAAENFLDAYLNYSSVSYTPLDRVNAAKPYITDEVYEELKPSFEPELPDDYTPDSRFSFSSYLTIERMYYTQLEDGGANILALCTLEVVTTYGSSEATQMICLDLSYSDQWKVSDIVFMETLEKSLF